MLHLLKELPMVVDAMGSFLIVNETYDPGNDITEQGVDLFDSTILKKASQGSGSLSL